MKNFRYMLVVVFITVSFSANAEGYLPMDIYSVEQLNNFTGYAGGKCSTSNSDNGSVKKCIFEDEVVNIIMWIHQQGNNITAVYIHGNASNMTTILGILGMIKTLMWGFDFDLNLLWKGDSLGEDNPMVSLKINNVFMSIERMGEEIHVSIEAK